MTREIYKSEILVLRARLKKTGHGYLFHFLNYWFPNIEGETYDRYRRDLQTFLRGAGFIHAYTEPYAFLPKIHSYLKDYEIRKKQAQQRTQVEGRYKLAK